MGSKSIDWDEVLLTKDPKKKEIEVSFKKIDADGNLISFGDEPGTPPGTGEQNCSNFISSTIHTESYLWQDSQPFQFYVTLTQPLLYDLTIGLIYSFPGDEAAVEAPSSVVMPAGQKFVQVNGALSADATTLVPFPIDINIDYSIDGNDPCLGDFGLVKFDESGNTEIVLEEPTDPEGNGEPIPGSDPLCQPGGSCDSFYNRSESTTSDYNSVYFVRPGFDVTFNLVDTYKGDETNIGAHGRDSELFVLKDKDGNTTFDGNATSVMPGLTGQYDGWTSYSASNTDGASTGWYRKGASPTNTASDDYATESHKLTHCQYPNGTDVCGNKYFMAFDTNDGRANSFGQGFYPQKWFDRSMWFRETVATGVNSIPVEMHLPDGYEESYDTVR